MRVLAGAIAVVLLLACTGCITGSLWAGAVEADWSARSIHGLVVDAQGTPQALVVEYSRPWIVFDEPRYAVLAVDASGRALPPYAAPELESATDLRGIAISDARREALVQAEMALLREVKVPPRQKMLEVRTIEQRTDDCRVQIIAYELPSGDAEAARPAEQPQRWPFRAEGMLMPELPLDRVLIVPAQVPRTPLERGKSIVGAVFLTPVAVVAEVTLTPLLLVGVALTGEWL